MIDGIKILLSVPKIEAWKAETGISFDFWKNEKTGEKTPRKKYKKGSHSLHKTFIGKAGFETYELIHKETHKDKITDRIIIEGSLHKNFYKGSNALPFKWNDLQTELLHTKDIFRIGLELMTLQNLEVGLNIVTPFAPFPFLQKNLILHKTKPFREYDPDENGKILGYQCQHSQYSVKVYDKGLQHDLPFHLMRFELRFTKMEIPNRLGVFTLADLRHKKKVNKLFLLLIKAWQEVFLYDYDIDLDHPNLTKYQRDVLMNGKDRTHWQLLKNKNRSTFNKHRRDFKTLVATLGKNYHSHLEKVMQSEWEALINNRSTLPTLTEKEMHKLTIKVNCQNVHLRYCASCGKDITHQKRGSKFCSKKYVGQREAKKCRNMDSNPRNNEKLKLEKEKRMGLLFDIGPFLIKRKRG